MFIGLHAALAEWCQVPELYITEQEADAYFKAWQNVARHYNVQTTQKTIDFIALAGIHGTIYGRRFAAFSARKYMERQQRPNNVTPIRSASPPQEQRTTQKPETATGPVDMNSLDIRPDGHADEAG